MINRPEKRIIHLPNTGAVILKRQIPGGGAGASLGAYVFGQEQPGADYFVVYGDLPTGVLCDLPRERRILFILEPPGILNYSAEFLNQFGVLVSPYPIEAFKGRIIISQPALRWWLGIRLDGSESVPVLDFDELARLSWPQKTRTLSVISSTKATLPKHRARLAFIEQAAKRFGTELDVFGRGFKPIADKADAILPYRYHLVLENNDIPNFWTEKLADAYLGYTFPFFSGCRNLADYFPADSFLPIDISDPERAFDVIEAAIEKDLAGQRRAQIEEARRRLLYEHNLFAVIERVLGELDDGTAPARLARRETIRPLTERSRLKVIRRWIRSRLGINQNLRTPRRR